MYYYKNDLKQGKVKNVDALIKYNKGIIEEYIYYSKDKSKIIHYDNPNSAKLIIDIRIGAWFENQRNDTLYFADTTSLDDSTKFNIGLMLFLKNDNKEFIEINQL